MHLFRHLLFVCLHLNFGNPWASKTDVSYVRIIFMYYHLRNAISHWHAKVCLLSKRLQQSPSLIKPLHISRIDEGQTRGYSACETGRQQIDAVSEGLHSDVEVPHKLCVSAAREQAPTKPVLGIVE